LWQSYQLLSRRGKPHGILFSSFISDYALGVWLRSISKERYQNTGPNQLQRGRRNKIALEGIQVTIPAKIFKSN
jgi:hypothetical protein